MSQKGDSKLIWVLGGALVLALIVIAFLLGRQTTPAQPPPPPIAAAPPSTPIPPPPAPPSEVLPTRRAPPPMPMHTPTTDERIERRPGELVITNVSDDRKDAIRAYFAQVDAIQAGPTGMSPDAYAQSLLADVSSGDRSGVDKLDKQLAEVTERLGNLQPPPECAEYHTLALKMAKDAEDVMRGFKDSLDGRGDLNAVLGKAQAAQTRQKQLDRIRARLLGP